MKALNIAPQLVAWDLSEVSSSTVFVNTHHPSISGLAKESQKVDSKANNIGLLLQTCKSPKLQTQLMIETSDAEAIDKIYNFLSNPDLTPENADLFLKSLPMISLLTIHTQEKLRLSPSALSALLDIEGTDAKTRQVLLFIPNKNIDQNESNFSRQQYITAESISKLIDDILNSFTQNLENENEAELLSSLKAKLSIVITHPNTTTQDLVRVYEVFKRYKLHSLLGLVNILKHPNVTENISNEIAEVVIAEICRISKVANTENTAIPDKYLQVFRENSKINAEVIGQLDLPLQFEIKMTKLTKEPRNSTLRNEVVDFYTTWFADNRVPNTVKQDWTSKLQNYVTELGVFSFKEELTKIFKSPNSPFSLLDSWVSFTCQYSDDTNRADFDMPYWLQSNPYYMVENDSSWSVKNLTSGEVVAGLKDSSETTYGEWYRLASMHQMQYQPSFPIEINQERTEKVFAEILNVVSDKSFTILSSTSPEPTPEQAAKTRHSRLVNIFNQFLKAEDPVLITQKMLEDLQNTPVIEEDTILDLYFILTEGVDKGKIVPQNEELKDRIYSTVLQQRASSILPMNIEKILLNWDKMPIDYFNTIVPTRIIYPDFNRPSHEYLDFLSDSRLTVQSISSILYICQDKPAQTANILEQKDFWKNLLINPNTPQDLVNLVYTKTTPKIKETILESYKSLAVENIGNLPVHPPFNVLQDLLKDPKYSYLQHYSFITSASQDPYIQRFGDENILKNSKRYLGVAQFFPTFLGIDKLTASEQDKSASKAISNVHLRADNGHPSYLVSPNVNRSIPSLLAKIQSAVQSIPAGKDPKKYNRARSLANINFHISTHQTEEPVLYIEVPIFDLSQNLETPMKKLNPQEISNDNMNIRYSETWRLNVYTKQYVKVFLAEIDLDTTGKKQDHDLKVSIINDKLNIVVDYLAEVLTKDLGGAIEKDIPYLDQLDEQEKLDTMSQYELLEQKRKTLEDEILKNIEEYGFEMYQYDLKTGEKTLEFSLPETTSTDPTTQRIDNEVKSLPLDYDAFIQNALKEINLFESKIHGRVPYPRWNSLHTTWQDQATKVNSLIESLKTSASPNRLLQVAMNRNIHAHSSLETFNAESYPDMEVSVLELILNTVEIVKNSQAQLIEINEMYPKEGPISKEYFHGKVFTNPETTITETIHEGVLTFLSHNRQSYELLLADPKTPDRIYNELLERLCQNILLSNLLKSWKFS